MSLTYNKYWYPKGELMQINITGTKSVRIKRLISQALEYYCSLLMHKRTANILDVDIILKKKLEDNAEGYCYFCNKDIGYRGFELQLKKNISLRDIIKTLAHESVHIKQFAKGELKEGYLPSTSSLWKGKLVNELKIDYEDFPWEQEAYEAEDELFYSFFINLSEADRDFLKNKVI